MEIFGIMMLVFVVTIFIGVPIAISIGIAVLTALYMAGIPVTFISQIAFSGLDGYTFLAIPMFILVGCLMETGGLSKKLVAFASSLIGNVHGGLGIVTVVACMFFAAISGSSPATVAAIGSMMIPSMVEKGYDKDFSGALTASAGSLGVLIPPSIPMILYAVTAEVSVGDMFLAGFIPGAMIGGALILTVYIISRKKGYRSNEGKFEFKKARKAFWEAKWALFTPVLILGGIYSGIFTATEAAVVAVIYSFLVGKFIHKEIKWSDLKNVLCNAAVTTGSVVVILGFATAFARYLTISGIPRMLGNAILSVTDNPQIILALFVFLIFFTGMFIETAAQIFIYTPLFLPVLKELGVDPIHFGIILVIGTEIGMITPPVGVNLFVAQGITGSSIISLSKKLMPFLLSMLIIHMLLTFIPGLVTFIPNLMRN